MVHNWFYNQRGSGSGTGNGGKGKLRITSEPIKMLAATQTYWHKYSNTKVREQLLERWKAEESLVDNTEHLGEEEGLSEIKQLTAEEQKVNNDALLKTIPFGFASVVVNEMYRNEPQKVKDEIDTERKAGQKPMEKEVDLFVRRKRLVKVNESVHIHIDMIILG